MKRLFANRWSVVCASCLAIICLGGIINAAHVIATGMSPVGLIRKADVMLPHSYSVLHNGQCVAELSTSYEELSEQISFIVHGNLTVRVLQDNHAVRLSGFVQFNSFKQFTGGMLYIRTADAEIKLQADGITTVQLKLLTNRPQVRELMKYNIPGPILLLDYDQQHFKLSGTGQLLERLLNREIPGSLSENSNQPAVQLHNGTCPDDKQASLDITPLVNLATRLQENEIQSEIEKYVKHFSSQ